MQTNMMNGFYIIRTPNPATQTTSREHYCKALVDYLTKSKQSKLAFAKKAGVAHAALYNCIHSVGERRPSRITAVMVALATDGAVHPADILPKSFDRAGRYTRDDIHPLTWWLRQNKPAYADVAAALGISTGHLTRLLRGRTRCTPELADRIESYTNKQVLASDMLKDHSHTIY